MQAAGSAVVQEAVRVAAMVSICNETGRLIFDIDSPVLVVVLEAAQEAEQVAKVILAKEYKHRRPLLLPGLAAVQEDRLEAASVAGLEVRRVWSKTISIESG